MGTQRIKLLSTRGKRQNKQNKKNTRSPKRWLWIAVCCVFLITAAIAVSQLVPLWSGNTEPDIDDSHPVTASAATPLPAATPVPAPTPTAEPEPEEEPEPEPTLEPTQEPVDYGICEPDREIDFETLTNRNTDVIAWINVPGTEIDYPVVISYDNYEYLVRDLDGKRSTSGTIFIDMINHPDFSERVTVMYGHNMRNGTKFAGLHKFRDAAFFAENREFKLYTPEGMRIYDIIAAYVTDDRNILYQTDYSDDVVWKEYIEKVFGNTDTRANLLILPVGENDRILTLSTCVSGRDEERFLVQGLLRKNDP